MTQKYEHVLNVMIDQGGIYPSHVPKGMFQECLIIFLFYSYYFMEENIAIPSIAIPILNSMPTLQKNCIVWHCNHHGFFVRLYMYKNCQGYGLYSITRVHTSYNTIWLNCLQCPQPLLTDKNRQRLRPYKLFVFYSVSFMTHN